MRKTLVVLVATVLTTVLGAAPALARADVPANSSAFGQSRADWSRAWSQWFYGTPDNPVLSGGCGEMVGKVFMMVPPIESGVQVDCSIPKGVPVVFSHAGYTAWVPDDGDTGAELEQAAADFFGDPPSEVVVDGQQIPLTTTATGAFDLVSEAGSLYDVIFDLGTGPVLSAVVNQLTILRPMTPGDHTVTASVDFAASGGPIYDITYNITVG